MFESLIGAQVVSIGEDSITVKLDGKTYTLELDSYYGGCCGYADFKTNMLYSEGSELNPIITNVSLEDEDSFAQQSSVLTFYGENKEIASIESEAGSGSGWNYGATVSLRCKPLDIDIELASW